MYIDQNHFRGKRAIAYIRKSTNDNNRQKYSIQSQHEQMEKWCHDYGVQIDKLFKDDHSAKNFDRPGWNNLIGYLKKYQKTLKIDLLLVIDYSRFSRDDVLSYVAIHALQQFNIELQAIDQIVDHSVPESRLMLSNYISLPAVDNHWRSIKVKRGMVQSLRAGNLCSGKPPRGFWRDKNANLIIPTEEGRMIGMAFNQIAAGHSIKDTVDFLNLRGVRVSFQTLSKILRNPFYSGKIRHALLGDELATGKHEGVVSADTFQKVQDILEGNHKGVKTESDPLYPLKGFMSCAKCGGNHTGYQVKSKQKPDGTYRIKKSKPTYYKCRCTSVSTIKVHEGFTEVLQGFSIQPNNIDRLQGKLSVAFDQAHHQHRENARIAAQNITLLTERLEKLDVSFIDGDIPKEVYHTNRTKWSNEVQMWKKNQVDLKQLSNPSKFINFSMQMLTKMASIWQKSSIIQKRLLQKLVFPEGLRYDKQNHQYLTPRVNGLVILINSLSETYKEKTKPSNSESLVYSPIVVRRGIEPLLLR